MIQDWDGKEFVYRLPNDTEITAKINEIIEWVNFQEKQNPPVAKESSTDISNYTIGTRPVEEGEKGGWLISDLGMGPISGEEFVDHDAYMKMYHSLQPSNKKEDYERDYSHFHCWNQGKVPACGLPLKTHKICCLCAIPKRVKNPIENK